MKKTSKKHGLVMCVTLLLVACGAKYLPPLWSDVVEVFEDHYVLMPASSRLLADGSVRRVWQSDANTLVVTTLDENGELLDRREFSHFADYSDWGNPLPPLFVSDNDVYVVGPSYAQTALVDVAAGTISPLPDISMQTDGARFLINDATLLGDGSLLLAGAEATGFLFTTGRARIVVYKPGEPVQSLLVPDFAMFSQVTPVQGARAAYLQAQLHLSDPAIRFQVYLFDGQDLVEQPAIGADPVLYADQYGTWTYRYGNPESYLRHFDEHQALAWQIPVGHAGGVSPTSDGHYVVRGYKDDKAMTFKMDRFGNVLWQVPAPRKTMVWNVVENNGRIVVTEYYTNIVDSFRPDPADASRVQDISISKDHVRYRVLDTLTGTETARFAEQQYTAISERIPLTGQILGVLEYTAGSCVPNQTLLRDDGTFYALSKICTDDTFYSNQQNLSLFKANAP